MVSNKSTVTKNTIILYFRMMFSLLVSLYTSRVILLSLGVTDFGIYNVVGGIVATMNFMHQSLIVSFQRFFCKNIPSNNYKQLGKILGSAFFLILLISIIVCIIIETIGLWFLNTKLNIPSERILAANIVLQLSVVVFIVSLFQAVYNSIIISFEKMNIYAYISIFDVTAKLAVAWIVSIITFDKLISYSFLLTFVALISFSIYYIYVNITYKEIKITFKGNRSVINELFRFSGMSMVGTIAHVTKNTGLGFLLNIYFGPALNAARGISMQIYTAVSSFTHSFQTAFSPNMMKQYETGTNEDIENTLYVTSKLSFFAMFLLAYPIIMAINPILNLWLGSDKVPLYSNMFSIIILCIGLIETLSNPIVNIVYAKGKINGFMGCLSLAIFLCLPISYGLLVLGCNPISVYLVDFAIMIVAQIVRVIFLHKLFGYRYKAYFRYVLRPIIYVILIAGLLLAFSLFHNFSSKPLLIYTILAEILSCIAIYYIGITNSERSFITSKLKSYVFRYYKSNKSIM